VPTSAPVRVFGQGRWGPQFCLQEIPDRTSRHNALNDLVARAHTLAGLPFTKVPHGSTRSDGKRPGGVTMVPWKEGEPLTYDVTVSWLNRILALQPRMLVELPNWWPFAKRRNMRSTTSPTSFSLSWLNPQAP